MIITQQFKLKRKCHNQVKKKKSLNKALLRDPTGSRNIIRQQLIRNL